MILMRTGDLPALTNYFRARRIAAIAGDCKSPLFGYPLVRVQACPPFYSVNGKSPCCRTLNDVKDGLVSLTCSKRTAAIIEVPTE